MTETLKPDEERAKFEAWLKLECKMTYRLAYDSNEDDDEAMITNAKATALDMRAAWLARAQLETSS